MTLRSATPGHRLGRALLAAFALLASQGTALAQDKPLAGVTLTLASQNDQFAAVLAQMAPEFKAATGADLKVEWLDQHAAAIAPELVEALDELLERGFDAGHRCRPRGRRHAGGR